MRRIILLALVALMAASASPVRAVEEALSCEIYVSLPEFPGVGAASVASGSTCTLANEAPSLSVSSSAFDYEDDRCHTGTASGSLVIGSDSAPFAYRRVGTDVKIDVIFRGQHYAGVWQLVFTTPNMFSDGGAVQLAETCSSPSAVIAPAAFRLVGPLSIS